MSIAQPQPTADLLADGMTTVSSAAEFLPLSKGAVYAAMAKGELAFVEIGRARPIPRRALVAFASANLKGGWSSPPQPSAAQRMKKPRRRHTHTEIIWIIARNFNANQANLWDDFLVQT